MNEPNTTEASPSKPQNIDVTESKQNHTDHKHNIAKIFWLHWLLPQLGIWTIFLLSNRNNTSLSFITLFGFSLSCKVFFNFLTLETHKGYKTVALIVIGLSALVWILLFLNLIISKIM